MASLPKELKQRVGKARVHRTTPPGHAGDMPPESGEVSMNKENKVDSGSFLDHPQMRSHAVKQKKLVNDTAYFLHHPQIKPHGPNMPPKKPKC